MDKAVKIAHLILAAQILALAASCAKSNSVAPPPPSSPVTPAPSQSATCDCTLFPPRKGCDSQCGITTGIVESVSANSVVVRVPLIKKLKAGGQESAQIQERTFSVSPAGASQLQSIKPGSRVALTFQKNDNAVQSIRELPEQP